jgi:hypothetical protein
MAFRQEIKKKPYRRVEFYDETPCANVRDALYRTSATIG